MIDVEDLAFDYPSGRALHGLGFVVRPGAVVGLIGEIGAGKSTLMRCLAALETPEQGRITVGGRDTQRDPRGVHSMLGYLPDAFGLYDALSVGRCLIHAARSRGVTEDEATDAAVAAAELVGLSGRAPTPAGALPAAERWRLGLAQAVVHHPRVLLLDEPPESGRAALASLLPRFTAAGMTVMVSAPGPETLPAGCTDLLQLDAGRIVGEGVVRLPGQRAAGIAST